MNIFFSLLNHCFICTYKLCFLLTVVGFSIYKSYYISEQKIKYTNVYRIFVNEYIKRIKENKTLEMGVQIPWREEQKIVSSKI